MEHTATEVIRFGNGNPPQGGGGGGASRGGHHNVGGGLQGGGGICWVTPNGMGMTLAMESSHGESKIVIFDQKEKYVPLVGPRVPPLYAHYVPTMRQLKLQECLHLFRSMIP